MRVRDSIILKLKPYEVEKKEGLIYLASNESPFDIPATLKERILEEIQSVGFNCYPDIMSDEIRAHIAGLLGVDKDEIIVGNGSDEILLYLTMTFAGCGGCVVSPSPSFSMYRYYALVSGAEYVEVELDEDFSLPVGRMQALFKDRNVSVVFIAYPNNPTANLWDKDTILRILTSTDAVVVVDEAYFDFSASTLLPHLHDFPNLVISRTFSKAWSLAGLRCGYIVANKELIDILKRVKQPFNVNILTQIVVRTCLHNHYYLDDVVRSIVAERERLQTELSSIGGIELYPSYTNFVVLRGKGLTANALYKEGIVVKEFSFKGEVFLRVTVGKPEENDIFVSAIRELMADGC